MVKAECWIQGGVIILFSLLWHTLGILLKKIKNLCMWEGRGCTELDGRICRHYRWEDERVGNNADVWGEELGERDKQRREPLHYTLSYLLSI